MKSPGDFVVREEIQAMSTGGLQSLETKKSKKNKQRTKK